MNKSAVIENAMALSPEERREVAEVLLDSVGEDGSEEPLSDEFKAKLDARLEAHRRNPTSGSTWEEVKARLLSRPR